MDVFSLRDSVVGEYRKLATSFTTIHAEDIKAQVEEIYSRGHFWPDPLIQINPSYRRGASLDSLVGDGRLDPRTAEIFRFKGAPLSLYKHQEQAMAEAARTGKPYETRLDPPPADPRVAHPESTRPEWARRIPS
jgi:hypothetical protein